MSIEIYTSDNLSIVAWSYLQPLATEVWAEAPEGVENCRRTLRLHISILVNWRIKNLFQQYDVVEEIGENDRCIKLENYHWLNTLIEILNQLWYQVENFYWIIDKALTRLYLK